MNLKIKKMLVFPAASTAAIAAIPATGLYAIFGYLTGTGFFGFIEDIDDRTFKRRRDLRLKRGILQIPDPDPNQALLALAGVLSLTALVACVIVAALLRLIGIPFLFGFGGAYFASCLGAGALCCSLMDPERQ